jgi:2-polyprenyl-3-methyl-5-hydroxy-6-metoxy-1,4-benzoquinol methylase
MIKVGVTPKTVGGINIFCEEDFDSMEDYDPSGLDALYQIEQKHFWFKGRNHVIADVFQRHIPRDSEIVEIGAGTGAVSRHLIENNYDIAVADIHLRGLKDAQSYGIKKCHKHNIYELPFEDEFDIV